MSRLSKREILAEIEFYKKRLVDDPAGKNLYEALLENLRRELKKYEQTTKNK